MASPDFDVTALSVNYYSDYWGPFTFSFPIESAAGENDGMIPFGDTLSSVTVRAFTGKLSSSSDLDDYTEVTDLVDPGFTPVVGDDYVTVRLQYPSSSTAPSGSKVTLVFEVTTANGGKTAFFFQYVKVA